MKFDRLMDFATYALITIIALSLVWAAISILFELKALNKEMEEMDRMENYCYR